MNDILRIKEVVTKQYFEEKKDALHTYLIKNRRETNEPGEI